MADKPKNDKLKNDMPERLSNVLFLGLWVAGHMASWVAAAGLYQLLITLRIQIESFPLRIILMALGVGIPTTLIQLLLIERGLRKTMRGWLPVSLVGWVVGGAATYWLLVNFGEIVSLLPEEWINPVGEIAGRLFFIPLFVPLALLQWVVLRRKVKSASLWVLSSFVGAMLMMLVQGLSGSGVLIGYLFMAIAALLYSAPTGATMLYLWTQSDEKGKNKIAQSEQSNADNVERLERLSDGTDERQAGLSDVPGSTSTAKSAL